jgi:hypothetical protein
MHANPYSEKLHRAPLVPRAAFSQPDDVEEKKETKRQYTEFVRSSGPPDPCDYENKDEQDVFSVPSSVNLLADDSINLEKKPAAKPIARASATVGSKTAVTKGVGVCTPEPHLSTLNSWRGARAF